MFTCLQLVYLQRIDFITSSSESELGTSGLKGGNVGIGGESVLTNKEPEVFDFSLDRNAFLASFDDVITVVWAAVVVVIGDCVVAAFCFAPNLFIKSNFDVEIEFGFGLEIAPEFGPEVGPEIGPEVVSEPDSCISSCISAATADLLKARTLSFGPIGNISGLGAIGSF